MAIINKCRSLSQFQQHNMHLSFFSLLFIMVVILAAMQHSVATAHACSRRGIFRCSEYMDGYAEDVQQQLKVLDAVEAQISYINLADNATNDKLQTLFRPGGAHDSKLTRVIKTLTKLNLMKERVEEFESSGVHTDVISILFNHVARDACLWLKARGLPLGNCTDISLLKQLYNRLNFIHSIIEAKVYLRDTTSCGSLTVDYCTWMNNRVLNNCEENSPYTRTSSLYKSLQSVCALASVRGPCRNIMLCPSH